MTPSDPDIRLLDPVDPHAPEADRTALLQEIVRSPVPPAARRSRRRTAVRLGLVGAAGAVAGGLALGMPGGTGTDVVASAYDAVSRPDTMLHYTQEWTVPAKQSSSRGAEIAAQTEVWQQSDGKWTSVVARAKHSKSPVPAGEVDATMTIDEKTQRAFERATPGVDKVVPDVLDLNALATARIDWDALGNPHTLLERARSGDVAIEELGAATVRGIPVLQFKVGECDLVRGRVRLAVVVSVARDGFRLVRVEQPKCGRTFTDAQGRPVEEWPGMKIDYLEFEVLSAREAGIERRGEDVPDFKVYKLEDREGEEE